MKLELHLSNNMYCEIILKSLRTLTGHNLLESMLTIDHFNTFIYKNLKKPSKKQQGAQLISNLQNFYLKYKMAFFLTLRTLITSIMFEQDTLVCNDWMTSRVLHSTIVMCEIQGALSGSAFDPHQSVSLRIIHEIIDNYERSPLRR